MQFFVRFVADWLMIPVVLISLYALVWRVPNRLRDVRYCYILMAGATAYTLAKVAGLLWQPEELRPFELIGAELRDTETYSTQFKAHMHRPVTLEIIDKVQWANVHPFLEHYKRLHAEAGGYPR